MKFTPSCSRTVIIFTVIRFLTMGCRSSTSQSDVEPGEGTEQDELPSALGNRDSLLDGRPGQPRYLRFSQHRRNPNNVQSNEFYRISMKAMLSPCGKDANDDIQESNDSPSTAYPALPADGMDETCQQRIMSEIYIETLSVDDNRISKKYDAHQNAPTPTAHWDSYDVHFHFLLDELFLPVRGVYVGLKETFVINVTLEVPYGLYALKKVDELNCYQLSAAENESPTREPPRKKPIHLSSTKTTTTTTMTTEPSKQPNTNERIVFGKQNYRQPPTASPPTNATPENAGDAVDKQDAKRRKLERIFFQRLHHRQQYGENQVYNVDTRQDPAGRLLLVSKVSNFTAADAWDHSVVGQTFHQQIDPLQYGDFQRNGLMNSRAKHPTASGGSRNGGGKLRSTIGKHTDGELRSHHEHQSSLQTMGGRENPLLEWMFPSIPPLHSSVTHRTGENHHRQYFLADYEFPNFYDDPTNSGIHHDYAEVSNKKNPNGAADSEARSLLNGKNDSTAQDGPIRSKPLSGWQKRSSQMWKRKAVQQDVTGTGNDSIVVGGRAQSRRYSFYRIMQPLVAMEPSSVVSIGKQLPGQTGLETAVIVESVRLTGSSDMYANKISSIRFHATLDAFPPPTIVPSTERVRKKLVDESFTVPDEDDGISVKVNHRYPKSATRTYDGKFNHGNWMLIDSSGSELLFWSDWQLPRQSAERPPSNGASLFERNNRPEKFDKLQWLPVKITNDPSTGNEKEFHSELNDDESSQLHKLFDNQSRYLICPELGTKKEMLTVESVRREHGGGKQAGVKRCEQGLCLRVPMAVPLVYKYEIELLYSSDRIIPPEPDVPISVGYSVKITKVIANFHGPLVSSAWPGSSPNRTDPFELNRRRIRRARQDDGNQLRLELALVNLGQHREFAQVNIDPACLASLSALTVGYPNRTKNNGQRVSLGSGQLQTVWMLFPISDTGILEHREPFECRATATRVKEAKKYPIFVSRHSKQPSTQPDDVKVERQFLIKPGARCLCSDFSCECICLLGSARPSNSTGNIMNTYCNIITTDNITVATGTDRNQQPTRMSNFGHGVWMLLLVLFGLLMILGCCKALLGCCYERIDKWHYDYLQPTIQYGNSSRYRRFLINLIFFLVFPCVFCCHCFEYPNISDEDTRLLLQQGRLKGTMLLQQEIKSEMSSAETTVDEFDDEWETDGSRRSGFHRSWNGEETPLMTTTDEELFKLLPVVDDEFGDGFSGTETGAGERLPYDNTEDEETDAKFVQDVMTKCRKSMQNTTRRKS
ncbi:uncharacterized protein LOC131438708 [Malaya genurostris]|uniref:uncharacterized protein LOC131438708 n=1 Tax=Malaya genurostris TaxID=325434 RepID=UPI0026F3E343|nr:uncharacterized protein LOC131438708 [Malaya genurostris]